MQVLDSDGSGDLEFCAAVKKLVRSCGLLVWKPFNLTGSNSLDSMFRIGGQWGVKFFHVDMLVSIRLRLLPNVQRRALSLQTVQSKAKASAARHLFQGKLSGSKLISSVKGYILRSQSIHVKRQDQRGAFFAWFIVRVQDTVSLAKPRKISLDYCNYLQAKLVYIRSAACWNAMVQYVF